MTSRRKLIVMTAVADLALYALLILLLVLDAWIFSGCAGSSLDRDFRRKVKSVEARASASQDREHGITRGELGGKITFRDPDLASFSK